jgi:hypothetical protein
MIAIFEEVDRRPDGVIFKLRGRPDPIKLL